MLTGQAENDLRSVWGNLNLDQGLEVRAALEVLMPDLIQDYGLAAAGYAALHYDQLRDQDRVAGRYSTKISDLPEEEQILVSTRASLGPLFKGENATPETAFILLAGITQRLIMEPARNTLLVNMKDDPAEPRLARIATQKECDFCKGLVTASVPVYIKGDAVAKYLAWHDNCRCQLAPVWEDSEVPDVFL